MRERLGGRKTPSVLKFPPPASPARSRLLEDAGSQLQTARCSHSAGVLFCPHTCLLRKKQVGCEALWDSSQC